jgi:hypothetical protein
MISGTILRGFVLSKLWEWFIVPITNLPIINLLQAIGLSLFVALIKGAGKQTETKKTTFNMLYKVITTYIIFTLFMWLFGWLLILCF